MGFESKHMSAEETMTTEEKQQYFEQLCQMDEAELRKLFENSEIYAKLNNLMKRYNCAEKKENNTSDMISRKKLHDSIGTDELTACLSDADILNCELNVDEDGELWFTEEQGKVMAAFCIAIRKFINDFPGIESGAIVGQYTGITDKTGKKIFVGNTVKVCLNHFEEDIGTVIFQDGAYGVKFNRLFSKVHNHFMTFHALITCYKSEFEVVEL